jgi:hypothetical protein
MSKVKNLLKMVSEGSEKIPSKIKNKIGNVLRKWESEAKSLQSEIEDVDQEGLVSTDKKFLKDIYSVCDEIIDTFDDLTESLVTNEAASTTVSYNVKLELKSTDEPEVVDMYIDGLYIDKFNRESPVGNLLSKKFKLPLPIGDKK